MAGDTLAYCGGTEFRQRVEAVLDPMLAEFDDFQKERRASETTWARREERYNQVRRGIAGLWGDVDGIIGTWPKLPRLELPSPESEGGNAV
jgi:hypothetical protein